MRLSSTDVQAQYIIYCLSYIVIVSHCHVLLFMIYFRGLFFFSNIKYFIITLCYVLSISVFFGIVISSVSYIQISYTVCAKTCWLCRVITNMPLLSEVERPDNGPCQQLTRISYSWISNFNDHDRLIVSISILYCLTLQYNTLQ